MESDESIDLVDSKVINTNGSVATEEEHENPCEHFEEGEMLIHHVFIPTSFFFIEVCHPWAIL